MSPAAETPVERIALAPGLEISRVVTGLWQVADMERASGRLDLHATARELAPYVEAGLTTFDVADHYGSAEEIVGALARAEGRRPEALTKWVPQPGPVAAAQVREAVERSLRRLDTDAIDLLQFHAWSYSDPAWLDALYALDDLRREGRIRHLGLTNFDTAHLRVVLESGIPVVSNQVCYSLLDQRPRNAMTELCRARGVALLAYGTLAGGLLTERYLGAPDQSVEEMGTWSKMKYRRFLEQAGGWPALQRLLAALAPIARRHGVSVAAVATRFILERPAVAAVIVGARPGESDHLAANRRLTGFALAAGDRAAIEAALAELQAIPGDCGDEYRRPPYLTASGDLSHHLDVVPPPYRPREDEDGRLRVSSGTPWEEWAGYSRAIRVGDRILVSGTTATHGGRRIGGDDPVAQAHFVIDKIEAALRSLGGRLEEVVRTRVFVARLSDWEAVARVHGERFGRIRPVNTLVEARLIDDGYLVEIEAEAVVTGSRARP
ncbi:MAG: aldo/keto reductase [Thermoanaerobaculia bacterium]|nr:aldo/keto reductase [Thermoanaerobaculia bacterium]